MGNICKKKKSSELRHDLKNHVHGIAGVMELLNMKYDDEYIKLIREELVQMNRLIDKIK